ncbi:unnamed protein product [Phytophthora lilii]|uniref:Unnamed protein product n=1 Tax=Phytophthora lilii TaxID=2077276 RepID=A0A9W6WPP1_9STRA|nr:unnamed protein product [Phytophthora lilii]
MAYPGQLKLVIREGEANFARLTKRRLQIFAEAAAELAAVLDPTTSNKPMRLRFLQVHQNFTFALETLMLPVMQSLEIVERDGNLGSNGVKLLRVLREIVKVNTHKLAEPCSKLCSASEKTFETQRLKMFGNEKEEPAPAKPKPVDQHPRMKLFGGTSKPVLKRSTTMDSASLEAEAAAKPKPVDSAHPLVTFEVSVRRLQTAIPLIGRPQTDAPATRNITWIAKELCRGSSPEVDYISTLEMLRADMTVRFKAEQIWIPGYQGHQVDAMLMPPASSGRDAVDRPVVILCNPNGGLYEFHHLQMDWIKFYTSDLDCHVLVYNYRGYGRCKGSPSPGMHNLDGLAIVNYLKSERGIKKIAVHGESIGGLVATYLARNSPHVSVLIADRTFATVPALAQRMIARWAGTLVDWVMRWETDNVQNYLDATCAKLLCSDPGDEIILDGASLKSGVALSLELGDKTFSLPRQREADGAPTLPPSPTNCFRKIRTRFGPRHTRRVSEAASRPQLGQPLTETMVARFSEAVLSVGRRALEYTTRRDKEDTAGHVDKALEEATSSGQKPVTTSSSHVSISVDNTEASAATVTSEDANDQRPMLPSDPTVAPTPITTTAAFPDELLAVIWMQLARLDGYCGQVLLQAAENGGYDKIRAWTTSLLTWGGRVAPECRNVRSLEPFDRDGIFIVPITVAEVHVMLQHLVEQYPPLKFDYDIGFVVLMVEYLNDALQRRWRAFDSTKSAETGMNTESAPAKDKAAEKTPVAEQSKSALSLVINTGDPKLGCLLPLHCGHNKNYEDAEKQALIGFLRHTNMNALLKVFYCFLSGAVLAIAAVKQPTLPTGECIVNVPGASEAASRSFNCQLAAFGAYLAEENEYGQVVLAPGDAMLACSPLLEDDDTDQPHPEYQGAAVIVRRGECSFQEKLMHVASAGAALMVLVNTEDALIPLSSLEYEHSTAAAVSIRRQDGEQLVYLMELQRLQLNTSGIALKIVVPPLLSQARARLQFLVDINAPVAVCEEYLDVAEPLVGGINELLTRISTEDFEVPHRFQDERVKAELADFLSWSAQKLSKWDFADQATFHAIVAAALLRIQNHMPYTHVQGTSQNDIVLQTAAEALAKNGYYAHSAQILRMQPSSQVDDSLRCQLLFLGFMQGDVIDTLPNANECTMSPLSTSFPSLEIARKNFLRLAKLETSAHDRKCLELAVGSVNDTNLAAKCCYLEKYSSKTSESSWSLSRRFSSDFVKELFYSLVMMGVFLDELGPFEESIRFFGFAARLCECDKTTLELLAVPIVFSSQSKMNTFVDDLKKKVDVFRETVLRKQTWEERMISLLGTAAESKKLRVNSQGLRPEGAAYLRYSITPATMFVGYQVRSIQPFLMTVLWAVSEYIALVACNTAQGIDVLPIQRAINNLRASAYPTLSSSFRDEISNQPTNSSGKSESLRRVGFISSWFRLHSVGKLLLGVVEKLNRTKFHVIVYRCVHFLHDSDEITDRFKRTADEYVELPEDQDAAVRILRQALLDVAIFPELGMDEWTVLLSHHRVAPIQCVFWGHPITTGNPHIDYFISSEHFVSKDFEEHAENFNASALGLPHLSGYHRPSFSEQIVLFRGLSTIFTEPKPLTKEAKSITRSRLPVVTLPAAQSVVHLAAGFLRYMNASDCIAETLNDYIQLAVGIAKNHEDIRSRLLAHQTDIYRDTSTIDDWNTFLDTVTPRDKNLR